MPTGIRGRETQMGRRKASRRRVPASLTGVLSPASGQEPAAGGAAEGDEFRAESKRRK